MGGFERRAVQPLGTGQVHVGLVDGCHFDLWRKMIQDFERPMRIIPVAVGVAIDEDGVRAEFAGGPQRHGRMYAELARLIRRRGNYAALIRPPTDDHGFPLQRRIEQFLDRNEEGVHIDMENGFRHGGELPSRDHEEAVVLIISHLQFLAAAYIEKELIQYA